MKIDYKKYAINYSKRKEWESAFETIKKIKEFRKKHKIQNTQCFLTNLTKNFTWKNVKIKIDYLDEKYDLKPDCLVFSSDNWINKFDNNKKIKFIVTSDWKKNFKTAGFLKVFPSINCDGNTDFYFPTEIEEAIFECFLMLSENIVDIQETLQKNLETFIQDASLKNFGITR